MIIRPTLYSVVLLPDFLLIWPREPVKCSSYFYIVSSSQRESFRLDSTSAKSVKSNVLTLVNH
jgi:hypothetical protein